MNNFDFSIYDATDETPVQPVKKQKETAKASQDFDFSNYDFSEFQEAPSPEEPKSVLWYENEKKKPFKEKIDELIPFGKGLASGASFGITENIPGLEVSEDDPFAQGGSLVGSALPIAGASKLVGAGAKLAFKNVPILQKFLHAFGTGATYESGKQGVNAISGKEVDLKQIPLTGVSFATIDSVLRGGSAVAKRFLKISPKNQAIILEQGIIPEDLPKSQYQTAEEMLKLIRQEAQPKQTFPGFAGGEPPPPGAPPAPLRNRITQGQDIGLRPAPLPQNPQLQDRVGNIFSPVRFHNTTQGGQAFKNEIMNIDEDVYRGVNELYARSRELNSEINEIHPQLVNRLRNRVQELEDIPEPSDVQRRVIRASNNIINTLAHVEDGNINGYLPINNQVLIDQVQSLRQIIDYDFAHGDTKNIFRPLINDLQDSAIRAAQNTNPEAAEALNQARTAYRTWAEAFDNPYIRPFRDASNQDFSKLFKSALDVDEFNMIRNILNISEGGQTLARASEREIAEKQLSKYFENPRKINERDFNKTLRELEAVITPEQTQQIREYFADARRRPDIRARPTPPRKPTNDEVIAARYQKNQPEDIQNLMNTRSGIKQLRDDFSDTKVKREVFDRLSKQKMRSILREGNVEKEFTGDDLYKFLNKEKNYELFSELLGETETENLRSTAKEIGKSQVKKEMRKNLFKKEALKIGVLKTLETIFSII